MIYITLIICGTFHKLLLLLFFCIIIIIILLYRGGDVRSLTHEFLCTSQTRRAQDVT